MYPCAYHCVHAEKEEAKTEEMLQKIYTLPHIEL